MLQEETYRVDVARVELGGLLEECQSGMRLDDVLHQGYQVLRDDARPEAPGHDAHELARGVVVRVRQSGVGFFVLLIRSFFFFFEGRFLV